MNSINQDARDVAESFIAEVLKPFMLGIPIYLGSRPTEDTDEDPDYFLSIQTEEEAESMPGDGIWILNNALVLVCDVAELGSDDHNRNRRHLRAGLHELVKRQNIKVDDSSTFYGSFITTIENANQLGHYGDVFFLETRVRG